MTRVLLALALAAAPLAAQATVSLGVEVTLAAPRLGMDRLPGSERPLVAAGDLGGAALLRLGPLALGVAADRTRGFKGMAASALVSGSMGFGRWVASF